MLKLIFKLVPIERLMMITDSMAASWIGEGEVTLGGLAVLVKDGKAVLKEGGALAGSALLYNEGVEKRGGDHRPAAPPDRQGHLMEPGAVARPRRLRKTRTRLPRRSRHSQRRLLRLENPRRRRGEVILLQPHGFQIRLVGEVRRHPRVAGFHRPRDGGEELALELPLASCARKFVQQSSQPSGARHSRGERREFAEVFLHPEDPAFFIA